MLYMWSIWFSQEPVDIIIFHIVFVGFKIEKERLTHLLGHLEPSSYDSVIFKDY